MLHSKLYTTNFFFFYLYMYIIFKYYSYIFNIIIIICGFMELKIYPYAWGEEGSWTLYLSLLSILQIEPLNFTLIVEIGLILIKLDP